MWQDIWPDMMARAERGSALQLGCGTAKLKPFLNADLNLSIGPDIVCDLDRRPYPFKTDSFDVVLALSILEHLNDFFSVMEEIHRISKDGAAVYILVPHFSSAAAFVDPTHRTHLSARSCDYFVPGADLEKEYGFYKTYRYAIIRRDINLQGCFNYIPPLRWFVNRCPAFWENYLCFIIRGAGVFWELKVIKPAKE